MSPRRPDKIDNRALRSCTDLRGAHCLPAACGRPACWRARPRGRELFLRPVHPSPAIGIESDTAATSGSRGEQPVLWRAEAQERFEMIVTAPGRNDSICSSTSFISGSVSASRVLPARKTTTATPDAGRCCWNCKFRSPVMKTSNRSCRILSSNSPFLIPLQPIRCTDVQPEFAGSEERDGKAEGERAGANESNAHAMRGRAAS